MELQFVNVLMLSSDVWTISFLFTSDFKLHVFWHMCANCLQFAQYLNSHGLLIKTDELILTENCQIHHNF